MSSTDSSSNHLPGGDGGRDRADPLSPKRRRIKLPRPNPTSAPPDPLRRRRLLPLRPRRLHPRRAFEFRLDPLRVFELTRLHFSFLFVSIVHSIIIMIVPLVHSQCIPDQQQTLLRFKSRLMYNASLSSKLITWNETSDCCSWIGVTCSSNGRVLGLDINNESISADIGNSSSLFHLQNLQSLNLGGNRLGLGQSIPAAFGLLVNLRYLNLSYTTYSGKIPIEISRLTRLVVLDVSYNEHLKIPTLNMLLKSLKKLRELYLDYVQISSRGSEWCQTISSSLPKLTVLSLIHCNLSGPFHVSLAKLQSLSVIHLGSNNFSAQVPTFFANFFNLTSLDLINCSLQGTFPNEVFQLPLLRVISLSGNENLYGSFPEFSGNSSIQNLDLGWTSFSGVVPNSIGNLKMLSRFHIGHCNFTGSIHVPSALFSLPLLESLDLSYNQFSGQFPVINSNMSSYSIQVLSLNNNDLEGPIPMSIFKFQSLRRLDLSSNNFSGSFLLDGLQHLRNLVDLDLSNNSMLFSHDTAHFTRSIFPQLVNFRLASGKLRTFPSFLRNQSELQTLDLSDNQIQGSIPNWIWRFKNLERLNLSCNSLETLEGHPMNLPSMLYIDLHSNHLYGKVPIFSAPNIYYLDYSRNNFNTTLPTTIGSMLPNLNYFFLRSNKLQGSIPISICNSLQLQVLDMSNNSLSGSIPHCLAAINTLSVLNLSGNNLTSVENLSRNCSLESLDISENHIRGEFPTSFISCHKLKVLNVGKNQITGLFPCFLKNTTTLRVLVLRSNRFYGSIRCFETNGSWPVLQVIDIADNDFSGIVPGKDLTTWEAMINNKFEYPLQHNPLQYLDKSNGHSYYHDTVKVTIHGYEREYYQVFGIVTAVDFSCNKFIGSIPEEVGGLKSLIFLNFSNNDFTGEIPLSLSKLSRLDSLDLSNNKLSGQIPVQLATLTFLSFLNLSNNQLEGRIPKGSQLSGFSESCFEGNKDLFGFPLSEENRTLSPPSTETSSRYSANEIDWDVISFEAGFTCGMAIAIGSLWFCKKWRIWYYTTMCGILLRVFPQLEHWFGRHRRHVYIGERYGRMLR